MNDTLQHVYSSKYFGLPVFSENSEFEYKIYKFLYKKPSG